MEKRGCPLARPEVDCSCIPEILDGQIHLLGDSSVKTNQFQELVGVFLLEVPSRGCQDGHLTGTGKMVAYAPSNVRGMFLGVVTGRGRFLELALSTEGTFLQAC